MYNLTLHIEYLLLRHDCVVVPGIGAFINVRHAAHYDAEAGVWYPMTREVRFNPALGHDDGLLANSYARKMQVSFEEGREALRNDIRDLSLALDADGEVTMGHLGILRSSDGVTSFVPMETPDRWAAMLGHVQAPVARVVASPQVDSERVVQEAATEDIAVSENDGHISRRFDTTRNYYIAVNKVFARTAACFALVAVVTLSLLLPGNFSEKKVDQASVVPVETIIRQTKSRIAEPAQDTAVIEEKAVSVPDRLDARYHVVVATFRTPEEAQTYISRNSSTGYDLQIVSSATMSRVSAMSSDDRAELQRRLMEEDFRKSFNESWIWDAK